MSADLAAMVGAGAAVAGVVTLLLSLRLAGSAGRGFVAGQAALADDDLAAMFVFASGRHLALATLGFAALAGVAVLAWLQRWPPALAAALAALPLPGVVIRRLRQRRLAHIAAQVPDALAAWAELLKVGQGLHASLAQLAQRQPRPLGDELRVVLRQCRLGVPVDVAMEQMSARLGQDDLRCLASLLRLSRDLGGNLGESLQRLADLLRARLAMEARIRSLTSQGRLQGVIVGALPLLLMLALAAVDPGAMRVLFSHPLGWLALGAIVLLEAVGFILIRRIVSIEV